MSMVRVRPHLMKIRGSRRQVRVAGQLRRRPRR
jgi:hypothetical protein